MKRGKGKNGGSTPVDGHTMADTLLQELNEALAIPIPAKEAYWQITDSPPPTKPQRRTLILFPRKNDITPARVDELQNAVIQTPGSSRTVIDKLKKQYPGSATLSMLSAICSYGMLLHSYNQDEMLECLKMATKEAASSMNSFISVHNCEYFFKIYFAMLEKLKRKQIHVLNSLRRDRRTKISRRNVMNAMALTDQLASEKTRISLIMARMKKKLTSSHYTASFNFMDIKRAVKHVKVGQKGEKCALGTAADMIANLYALSMAMARVPIFSPLISKVINQLPDDHPSFLLRKISIQSARNFNRMKLASIEGDRTGMTTLGKTLLKENLIARQKMDGQALHHSYETDPFFNLSLIAQMTQGLYNKQMSLKMVEIALEAMDSVIKRDMSRNNIFTRLASEHAIKLAALRDGIDEDLYQEQLLDR
ncbi:hypothetical protein KKI24_05990 [bacterium]|nr:hypothetical protein [bacterium]